MKTLAITAILSLFVSASSPPTLVRIAIVDTSGSMEGERIAAVHRELAKVIRQLPPSPEFPLLLIVFNSQVGPTHVFTDGPSAEKAAAALNAGGGTHIAPALVRAYEELRHYQKTANALVMLYTDGEDSDQEGIRRAETQLDALFNDRSKEGLGQSVFVKRWENANAELIARLRAHGHAQVLDAGELSVEPLSFLPAVQVVAARRDPEDARRLQVAFAPSVALKGKRPTGTLPGFKFACRNAGAEFRNRVEIQADAPARNGVVTLPIPADAERAGEISLVFDVSSVAPTSTQTTYVLPIMLSSTVVVPVKLPPLALHQKLTAEIRQVRALRWDNPVELKVKCQIDLELTVTAVEQAGAADRSTTFRIVPGSGVHLADGADTVHVAGPGTIPLSLSATVRSAPSQSGKPAQVGPIELAIQPIQLPDHLSYDPPVVRVRHASFDAPERMTTTITSVAKRIGKPVWIDLIEPLAAFDADVLFRVDGPITNHATLTVVAPGNIRGNLVPPGTLLHSGESVVTLHVVARLNPGKPERLDFSIVAPPPTPALEFRVAHGFTLPVVAPPAAVLASIDGAKALNVVRQSVADNQDEINMTLVPAPIGIDPKVCSRLPRVVVGINGPGSIVTANPAPMFRSYPLRLLLPPPSAQPFFTDAEQTVSLELHPDSTTPAVVPTRLRLTVTRHAPFKRLLVYLAWAAFLIGDVLIIAHAIRRLRERITV
jgi:hypothetical protein